MKTHFPLALAIVGAAALSACATYEQPAPITGLSGSTWKLVSIASTDDAQGVKTPGERSYALTFNVDGTLNGALDCNRAAGRWTTSGENGLSITPMTLTRALCPEPRLDTVLVEHLPHVASYQIKDGRLFLTLQADGGILEFEPAS
ncbi:MAG: META domain-containing protein [Novosphingobium sp.]|uniref:META domain-containing protein n=1 Tax=Tsuneonella sp. CC-YZS046 TaxID=3042152 RepID=UPI002D79C9B0|nr:META domain-containing protein [Tsuneonella sp. CC-YZS046]WRO68077.1 META domain-containing protein [Tsuneonella sp. CC-YZS046]